MERLLITLDYSELSNYIIAIGMVLLPISCLVSVLRRKFKRYEIYEDSNRHYLAVKKGWSWPAYFFSFLWALGNKMWVFAIAGLPLWFLLFILGHDNGGLANFILVSHIFVFGLVGNKLRARQLTNQGCEYKGIVMASNPVDAIKFYTE